MTANDFFAIGVNQKSYPQYLFKYRADSQNTERIITNNEMWFSSPLDFNDPFDCNTPISTNTPLDDIKDWLKKVGVNQQIDYWANILKTNPNIIKESTEKVLNQTGICCFSTLFDSILMWSHYSDYHKGIVLKFDILEDPDFFQIPVIVSYKKIMQHYNHIISPDKILEYLIRPKYSDWSYESEVRILKTESAMKANNNNRIFTYKDTALKEIIFGLKTPQDVIDKYKDLCAKNNKISVQFSKMELGQGTHYELIKTVL